MNPVESPDTLAVNTIRTLAMDAVERAGCGHPGTPMALAPLGWVLFSRILKLNPERPGWPDRDRFVVSAGHASMLQYALLLLAGYDLSLDDLKAFRQWGSKTPGHPEHGMTPGVETTTGPLGQGLMNAVGMALAERHLAAVFNREGFPIVDHRTYVVCGDGDLMEGASHEACSLGGHLGLSKLTVIYDDNRITIEGSTSLACSDDVAKRFDAYGFLVIEVGDHANDLDRLTAALEEARSQEEKPALIVVRSHIGYGSPNRQDTAKAHGEALGAEEIALAKRAYGWPEEATFLVPDEVKPLTDGIRDKGRSSFQAWNDLIARYQEAHPNLALAFREALEGNLPDGLWNRLPSFDAGSSIATRAASGQILVSLAKELPTLIGGSADLAPSNKTRIDGGDYERKSPGGRVIHFGIREHAMVGCLNGMALHGGLRPFGATFFVFSDYARPSIRLAALMEQPIILVMTHDSIGVGEDGPTHQPIEQLASLRAIPNLYLVRPADATETLYAWRIAIERHDGPTMLVLSRQKLPNLDRRILTPADGTLRGAYVLAPEKGSTPDAILIGTGSEVEILLETKRHLDSHGQDVRVVSMPCWELFRRQPADYREAVLPSSVTRRLSLEAGATLGWKEWVGDRGIAMGIDRFGASAPASELYKRYALTADEVCRRLASIG